jgi:hypothetical protein
MPVSQSKLDPAIRLHERILYLTGYTMIPSNIQALATAKRQWNALPQELRDVVQNQLKLELK